MNENTYTFDLLTLFPALFDGLRSESLLGKALQSGALDLQTHNWRQWTTDRHNTVDDLPFGGGPGMVLKPDPIVACLRELRPQRDPRTPVVLLSPAGRLFRQDLAEQWAQGPGLILLCGRYEGFDARVEQHVDQVVSIGDYVLNGGEVAAMAIIEAVARLLPGVIGNSASLTEESHSSGLLEHPHYTRPREFEGAAVPEVLLSGNHAEIDRWRRRQSLLRTKLRRPELLQGLTIDKKDRAWLDAEWAQLQTAAAGQGGDRD
ncbi:MAG: tRNA (guanosine(37)-N1)-methyltransferase TrmD [Deltaproteobacteria bacterium]|nr:tRNA (guanosine(37)-N1)-methyltransferase TrmD [Deltaproteobacteria bacterium]